MTAGAQAFSHRHRALQPLRDCVAKAEADNIIVGCFVQAVRISYTGPYGTRSIHATALWAPARAVVSCRLASDMCEFDLDVLFRTAHATRRGRGRAKRTLNYTRYIQRFSLLSIIDYCADRIRHIGVIGIRLIVHRPTDRIHALYTFHDSIFHMLHFS